MAPSFKPSSCPECHEQPGWIVTDDPGLGATRTLKQCPHRTGTADPGVLLRRAGVPEREVAYTYDGLTPAQKGCLLTVEKTLSEGQDVLLVGPNGSGKTGTAVVALAHAAARAESVGYAYVRTLLLSIRQSFENPLPDGVPSEAEIIIGLVKPRLLLLDDLPDEQVSPHVRTTVLSILHQRRGYGAQRLTIVTSNPDFGGLRPADSSLPLLPVIDDMPAAPTIEELYGAGIADRLREYRRVLLDAPSRRAEQRRDRRKQLKAAEED